MTSNREARVDQLKAAAQRKHEDAVARANHAIVALENRRRPINFTSVALEAGVSKDFLYKNETLRRAIALKRGPARATINPTRDTTDSSATVKLQVATIALHRLRGENAALRAENVQLRGDLQAVRRRRPE